MAITPTVAVIIAAGGGRTLCRRRRHRTGQCAGPFIGSALHMISSFGVFRASKSSTKRRAAFVPFKRWAQLKLVRILLCDLFAGKLVRIVLLKARQWGGSTVVQMFMALIQLFHRSGWNSVIVADVGRIRRGTIQSMYSRMARRHPVEICSVQFCKFQRSSKNKMLVDRDLCSPDRLHAEA